MAKNSSQKIFAPGLASISTKLSGTSWVVFYVKRLTITFTVFLMSCTSVLQKAPSPPSDLAHWGQFASTNSQQIQTLKGKANFTVESPQMSGSMQLTIIWKQPDTLYLAAEGPLGINLGKVFIGHRRFIIYNEYQNQFVSSTLDNPFLSRFMQTSFSLQDLKYLLLGIPPSGWDNLQPVPGNPGLFIKFKDGVKYRYHVNLRSKLLEKWEMVTPAGTQMVMTLERYRSIQGVWFPRLIRLTRPGKQERLTLFYRSLQINSPIPTSEYTIIIKPGVQQLNVD